MNECILVMIILAVVILLLVLDVFPSALTVLAGCALLAATGVISWTDAFSGFSGSVTLLVLGVNMVALGLQNTGAARDFGALVLRFGGRSQRTFTLVACTAAILLSSVMSNIMVLAIMLPIVSSACLSSGGRLKRKYTYMALGIAANMGGSLSLIGAPQNMLVSGCLEGAGEASLSFFSFTPFGIVRSLLCLLFFATIGDYLQRRFFDFEEELPSAPAQQSQARRDFRYWCSILLMAVMIIGFLSGVWPIHAVAMTCGILGLMIGTIPLKDCLQKLPWNIIWLLAGSAGLGMAIEKSGAGEQISGWMIRLLGGHPSCFVSLIAFTLLTFILSNLMSSTALISVFAPMAITFFQKMGYPPYYVALAMGTALNFSCILPYATPPITMTMEGGYRVKDYVIVGGLFAVLGILTQILMYPVVFQM